MENKQMEKTIPAELEDDALDEVSGGLITDSVSKDDTLGEALPAILNPFNGSDRNSL